MAATHRPVFGAGTSSVGARAARSASGRPDVSPWPRPARPASSSSCWSCWSRSSCSSRPCPSIADDKSNFLISRHWNVDLGNLRFGIADLLWTTVLISVIAMLIAVPLAIGIALFITQYAPQRLAQPVAYVVDLLAAIPSIIYGIWGIIVLAPTLTGVQRRSATTSAASRSSRTGTSPPAPSSTAASCSRS